MHGVTVPAAKSSGDVLEDRGAFLVQEPAKLLAREQRPDGPPQLPVHASGQVSAFLAADHHCGAVGSGRVAAGPATGSADVEDEVVAARTCREVLAGVVDDVVGTE